MDRNRDLSGALDIVRESSHSELMAEVVALHNDARRLESKLSDADELLNATRDYTDTLKRRADLIHAISDHVTENALSGKQLNDIAAVIWPAPAVDPTQVPTGTTPAMSYQQLLNHASRAEFLLTGVDRIVDMIQKLPNVTMGDWLTQEITTWRVWLDDFRKGMSPR